MSARADARLPDPRAAGPAGRRRRAPPPGCGQDGGGHARSAGAGRGGAEAGARKRGPIRGCGPGASANGERAGRMRGLESEPKPRLAAADHSPISRLDHNGRESTAGSCEG